MLCLFFKLGTPKDIKYNNVKVSLESIEGVVAAHSLHIWSLTVNKAALSVHLAIGWFSELECFVFTDTYSLKVKVKSAYESLGRDLSPVSNCSMK